MAAPELVIANAAYKKYPGGVVAIRCADWLAGARGTLSTEADALSADGGSVVRDSQQVNNIRTAASTAYQAADDTLEISGPPFVNARSYYIYATIRIEGYTDVSDGALLRTGFNENWLNAAVIGAHTSSEASHVKITACPPPLPYYRAFKIGQKTWFTGDSWFIRMASESGTSIEWLLDQIVFFPAPLNSTEFPFASGSTLGLAANTQDGADGGDDNGKFTWFARLPPDGWTSQGDYQRYGDGDGAEYFTQVTTADGLTFWDAGDELGTAWMYSLHTAMYRGERTWTEDTFDNRDTSATDQDMGITPEGFGYRIGSSSGTPGNVAHCNGDGTATLSANHFDAVVDIDLGSTLTGAGSGSNQGLKFQLYDQWSWSTLFDMGPNTDADGHVQFIFTLYNVGTHFVDLDFGSQSWELTLPASGGQGTHDISSWFGVGAAVGIRIEVKRYLLRVRVWDASGSEPGTWDEEVFVDLNSAAYPYGDAESTSTRINAAVSPLTVQLDVYPIPAPSLPKSITLRNISVTHDPYGDPADMTVRMERPPGTELGDQVIPFGSSYFVYWGKRDWTDTAFGNDVLAWSTKVWNDPTAAEIQRAEVGNYYFFWFLEDFTIVSMNWRSSERRGPVRRVLLGSR